LSASSLRKERGAIAAQVSAVWAGRNPHPFSRPSLTLLTRPRLAIPVAVANRDVTSNGPSAARARSSASNATTASPSRPSMPAL
jgi:hypothetical protein